MDKYFRTRIFMIYIFLYRVFTYIVNIKKLVNFDASQNTFYITTKHVRSYIMYKIYKVNSPV